jgi:hypothetical protein
MALESTKLQPTKVEVLWKAWARAGAASGTYRSLLVLMLKLIRFSPIRIGSIWFYQGHNTDIRDWAK